MYKRIFVPIDGSRTSGSGLDEAVKLAKEQGADLCILHALDNSVLINDIGIDPIGIDRMASTLQEAGKKLLAKAEAGARKSRIPVKTILVENNTGDIASLIVRQARKWRADLIVLGTHGRQGVSRLVMGSEAEGVVREATVPVLLVRSKTRKTS